MTSFADSKPQQSASYSTDIFSRHESPIMAGLADQEKYPVDKVPGTINLLLRRDPTGFYRNCVSTKPSRQGIPAKVHVYLHYLKDWMSCPELPGYLLT